MEQQTQGVHELQKAEEVTDQLYAQWSIIMANNIKTCTLKIALESALEMLDRQELNADDRALKTVLWRVLHSL